MISLESMIRRLVQFILDHQKRLIQISLLLLIPCAIASATLRVNNTITTWFLETDPNLKSYYDFQKVFGNDEVVAVAVRDTRTVFNTETMEKISRVSTRIGKLEHVRRVLSITTATAIEGREGTVSVHPVLEGVEKIDSSAVDEVRRLLVDDPIWRGNILSEDLKTTLIIIQMQSVQDIDAARAVALEQIRAVLHEELTAKGVPVAIGGIGVIYDALNQITVTEGALLICLSYLLIIGSMFLILRHWKFAALGLWLVYYTATLTMGLYAMTGRSLNMVTIILPSLILVIAIADFVHVVVHFYHSGPIPEEKEARYQTVIDRVSQVAIPCLYTSLTTATGFLALTTSPISLVRDLGLFGGVGVTLAWPVTLLVASILLHRMDPVRDFRPNKPDGWMQRLLGWICAQILNRRALVTALTLGVTLFFAAGIGRIVVDTYTIGYFADSHPVPRDHRFIAENFGFYLPVELTVRTGNEGGFKEPALLRKLEGLEQTLLAENDISKVVSILDFSRRMHQALRDGKQEEYRLPETRAEAAQELLLYRMDRDATFDEYMTSDYAFTRLSGRMEMMSVRPGKELMERLEGRLQDIFKGDGEVAFAGYLPLYVKIIDYLVESQIQSFSLAVFFIFGPMYLLFRSLKLTLISVIPNVLPIVILLGAMGWSGIPLDVATVTIAAIVLGVAVDDTIHFLHGFKRRHDKGMGSRQATEQVILSTGKAVVTTTMLLFFGFIVMVVSSIKPVAYFGFLS